MAALLACLLLSACPARQGPAAQKAEQDNLQPATGESITTDVSAVNHDPVTYPVPDPATDLATLAVIGNFRGFQKPCSCTPEQMGGLARLGTALLQLDNLPQFSISHAEEVDPGAVPDARELVLPDGAGEQPLWLIDLGNFAWSPLHYPGLRASNHLQILAALGARAAIPGASELGLELDSAVSGLSASPIPLVSCNLQMDATGIQLQPSIQLAENWYLIGISADRDNEGLQARQDWWTLADANTAALAEMERMPADAHIVIAGANLDVDLASELLQDQRVVCCIGVPENYHRRNPGEPALFRDPIPRSPDLQLYSIESGDADTVRDWQIELSEDYGDDLRVMELIKAEGQQVRERLRERRAARAAAAGGSNEIEFGMSDKFLPETERAFSFDDPKTYVGAEQCLHCHREAASSWRSTRHAGAVGSLKGEGQADSLDCLACHSTGLLEVGGYDPLEPIAEMAGVSCENCHGAGSHHVQSRLFPDSVPEGGGTYISRETIGGCVRCHDPYNSPHFDLEKYWEEIRH